MARRRRYPSRPCSFVVAFPFSACCFPMGRLGNGGGRRAKKARDAASGEQQSEFYDLGGSTADIDDTVQVSSTGSGKTLGTILRDPILPSSAGQVGF